MAGSAVGLVRVGLVTVVILAASLAGTPAFAQWYRTYDDAVRAFNGGDFASAETKFDQAKKEAEAAGRRPGRNVLRYGALRGPLLPDYWLGRVYVELAASAADAAARVRYLEKALEAFAAAETSGQVREQDPERPTLQAAADRARVGLPSTTAGPITTTTDPARPTGNATDEVRRLVDAGDRAIASRTWDAAASSFQEASRRLDASPTLRSEFRRVPEGLLDAAAGRDLDLAADHLAAGRYQPAIDIFERVTSQSQGRSTAPEIRAMLADVPARVGEARIGLAIAAGDAALRERRWAAARDAYESAQRLAQQGRVATPRVRDSVDQIPQRLRDVGLNLALAERRFADALAIDPQNRAALDGQYGLALAAYNNGYWGDAVQAFTILRNAARSYRDATERQAAAEMQVEYSAGVASQSTDPGLARAHYERVQALRNTITGPLSTSPVVVDAAEQASSRLRRMTADESLKAARDDYDNGRWDRAGNNVRLVLSIYPDDPEAGKLLRRLDDKSVQESLVALTSTANDALARGDLSVARDAAMKLAALAPSNETARTILAAVQVQSAARGRRNRWLIAVAATASIGPLLLVSTRRRGLFLAAIGQPARAMRLYERVLTQQPTDRAVLQRAWRLVSTHGVKTPLDGYFERYLSLQPADTATAHLAARYFWNRQLYERAIALYRQLIASNVQLLDTDDYGRLDQYFQAGIPEEVVGQFEQVVAENSPAPAPLLHLVASEYARLRRTDVAALALYESVQQAGTGTANVRRAYAAALLANGRADQAVEAAESTLSQSPDDDAVLQMLLDAYAASTGGDAAAVERFSRILLPHALTLLMGERLADRSPHLRPQVVAAMAARLSADPDPLTASLVRAVELMDRDDLPAARGALDTAYEIVPRRPFVTRGFIQLYGTLQGRSVRSGRAIDGSLHARVAELHAELGAWQNAIAAWQQAVSIPEWNRRAISAIESILDTLDLPGLVQAYFATAGWRVERPAGSSVAGAQLLVAPGTGVNAELSAGFGDTQVFCHTTVVSVDDIVNLKRAVLARTGDTGNALAFLITTFAVRHDVYALIYAFMTESPSITFIPLDAQSLRDALIEARSRPHLERTLHQWLGHTDIYETHNPISNAATFFGRGQFINRLVLKISRGENFGIFGLRKIGKTSLVYRLRDLSRDHLVAYVDLQGVASRRVDEVYVRLIESLTRDTRIKYPDVSLPPSRTLAAAKGDDVASAFHEDVLAIRKAFEGAGRRLPHVLLLFDEIELMIPQDSSRGFDGHQDFFRHIRGLYQQERFIVSAVVGATPGVCRASMWNGRDNPVFQFYDEVFLASLDRVECNQMVQGLGELMGVRFEEQSLSAVYDQTAGHPYITRQLCSRLVKFFSERPLEVQPHMVAKAVDQYLAQSGDYFAGILEGYLDDVSRRIVETIAAEGEDGTDRTRILDRVDQLGVGRHVGDQALGDLELTGLVRRQGEQYNLCIPLFRRWLRRSWLDLE